MTKTHEHIPSGKHGYKFTFELRKVEGERKFVYVIVEEQRLFELGPWFNERITAEEMAEKATNGDQFCNAIPCVDYGSPIPRPDGSWYRPQEYGPRGT